jgi:hypothetical protein
VNGDRLRLGTSPEFWSTGEVSIAGGCSCLCRFARDQVSAVQSIRNVHFSIQFPISDSQSEGDRFSAGSSLIATISDGWNSRIGGPQNPVPLDTTSVIPSTSKHELVRLRGLMVEHISRDHDQVRANALTIAHARVQPVGAEERAEVRVRQLHDRQSAKSRPQAAHAHRVIAHDLVDAVPG